MSNAYFPVICENYLSMKGAKFDRNASGSRGSKKKNKKKLAKAIVDTLTKPEYKSGTAGIGKDLPEKYIGAMLASAGYQKIYSPKKLMSGYAKKNVFLANVPNNMKPGQETYVTYFEKNKIDLASPDREDDVRANNNNNNSNNDNNNATINTTSSRSLAEEIKSLKQMKDDGIIDEAEFKAAKAKLLQ